KAKNTHLDQQLHFFANCVEEIEERVGNTDDNVDDLQSKVTTVQKDTEKLMNKCDDLENHSRRSNLCLIGLPEGSEGDNSCQFLETWFPTLLNLQHVPHKLEINRAHCALIPKPPPSERPHMLIFKLLHYQDRELILKRARELKNLTFQGNRIHLFPDLSTELYRKRKEFDGAKRLCKELNLPFALLHPAKLKVTVKGRYHVFSFPSDAKKFLKSNLCHQGPQG
uniref:L1 transposable element RRM domain-containing protein n=1 Tax=Latimeria chalumnae TaxID=7897 RepID=H3AZW1_LATCH